MIGGHIWCYVKRRWAPGPVEYFPAPHNVHTESLTAPVQSVEPDPCILRQGSKSGGRAEQEPAQHIHLQDYKPVNNPAVNHARLARSFKTDIEMHPHTFEVQDGPYLWSHDMPWWNRQGCKSSVKLVGKDKNMNDRPRISVCKSDCALVPGSDQGRLQTHSLRFLVDTCIASCMFYLWRLNTSPTGSMNM